MSDGVCGSLPSHGSSFIGIIGLWLIAITLIIIRLTIATTRVTRLTILTCASSLWVRGIRVAIKAGLTFHSIMARAAFLTLGGSIRDTDAASVWLQTRVAEPIARK